MNTVYKYPHGTHRRVWASIAMLIGALNLLVFFVRFIRAMVAPIPQAYYLTKVHSLQVIDGHQYAAAFALPYFVMGILFIILGMYIIDLMRTFDVSSFNEDTNARINWYVGEPRLGRHKPYYLEVQYKLKDRENVLAKFTIAERLYSKEEIKNQYIEGNVEYSKLDKVIESRNFKVHVSYNLEHQSVSLDRYFPNLDEAEQYIRDMTKQEGVKTE